MSSVSIIIPAYNVGQYLGKCLDSIIAQTLQNIEIIVIDDGSTDDSGRIADEYAAADIRIRVIHQNNTGLGGARNSGLKIATGEYVGFVDSDDWISENYFESLYSAAKKHDADIAATSCVCMVFPDGRTSLKNVGFKRAGIMCGKMRRAGVVIASGMSCNKIYRAEFLRKNKIRFPDGRSRGEDNPVTIIAMALANKIATVIDATYFYLQRGNSLAHTAGEKDLGIADIYAGIISRADKLGLGLFWRLVIMHRARHDFKTVFGALPPDLRPKMIDAINDKFPQMRFNPGVK
jgi:glycosyltransferase involved in cell wall biosynthesis